MVVLRLVVLAVLAGLVLTVSAGCARRSGRPQSGASSQSIKPHVSCSNLKPSANALGMNSKSAHVSFDRNVLGKVGGKIKVGPCGRPKAFLDANFKDTGNTRVQGNVFQILETAGRFGEIKKIVGNRFKPEVRCPPRPPSNIDTSAESICAQRTIRRKPGKSSGRIRCNHGGSGSGSGSAGSGESSISFNDESSFANGASDGYNANAFGGSSGSGEGGNSQSGRRCHHKNKHGKKHSNKHGKKHSRGKGKGRGKKCGCGRH